MLNAWRPQSVGLDYPAGHRLQAVSLLAVSVAELDLGASGIRTPGNLDRDLPASRRPGLLRFGELGDGQTPHSQEDLQRHRVEDAVDLFFESPRLYAVHVEIDVLRIAQAVEEVAQVRPSLQHIASRVEAARQYVEKGDVKLIRNLCGGMGAHALRIQGRSVGWR